jgi:hypothetical protein
LILAYSQQQLIRVINFDSHLHQRTAPEIR